MAEKLTSLAQIATALQGRPVAVLTDMDGTLSPIADRAEEAFVPIAIKDALSRLLERGVKVAVITGRSLDVARTMADVQGVDFAASHGVDVWIDGRSERPAEVQRWTERTRLALAELRGVEGGGVWIEDKAFGLAVHYRQSEDGEAAQERVLSAIAASAVAQEFRVQEGRKIVELRPRLAMDKGTAAASLIERYGARGVVCMGDDVTDIDMFRSVRGLSESGIETAIVAVWSEEASAEVLDAADWWVDGVEGVEWLLGEMATSLR